LALKRSPEAKIRQEFGRRWGLKILPTKRAVGGACLGGKKKVRSKKTARGGKIRCHIGGKGWKVEPGKKVYGEFVNLGGSTSSRPRRNGV